MGQLLAGMITRADLLQAAIGFEEQFLGLPPSSVDGYGVGFFHAGEVLHRKRPIFESAELSWPSLFEDVSSTIALAHVRVGTVGEARADNTHPFRMRQWLFAHHGSIDRFDGMRESILNGLPDFLQRNIRGETDSEYIFHILLAQLHEMGQIDVQDASDETVVNALQATVAEIAQLTQKFGADDARLNIALTNGRALFLMRRGAPFYMVRRDHLPETQDGLESRPIGPVRYMVALSCDDCPTPRGYGEIPEGHIVRINRDLEVAHHPLPRNN